jgi:plastocyanin
MNDMCRLLIRLSLACPTTLMPAAMGAQAPQTTGIATTTIQLSNFAFEPEEIRLRTGVPVHLLLVNQSSGGHNFSAPGFFAASKSLTGSAPPVGIVDVPAKGRVEITVVPVTPGTYRVECTHFLHALFGMTGRIIVEAAQS